MKKKVLIWVLAAVLVLTMAGCAAGAVSTNDKYVDMEPTAAAEAAAAETKDTTGLSDLIRVPFGYLLDWLYTFTNNYGLALILFSLIVKLVLLPMSVKSKKSMLKMSRLSPQVKALEAKYGDDKQKYQLAVQQMYKEEGVSMGGGCLWSFIPLIILLPLYYVIREPITYMMHNSRSISEAIVAFIQASGENLGTNSYYAQLAAAGSYRRLYGRTQVPGRYGERQSAGHELPVPRHRPGRYSLVPLLGVRRLGRDRPVPDPGRFCRPARLRPCGSARR